MKLPTKIQDDRVVEEKVIRIAVTGQMQFSGAESSVLFLKFPAIQPLDRAQIFSGGSRHIEETLIQNSERSDGSNKSYSRRTSWTDVVQTKKLSTRFHNSSFIFYMHMLASKN